MKLSNIIACFLIGMNLKGQVTPEYLKVNPNPFKSRALATYSFSGAGTDTIGVYVTNLQDYVIQTLRSNYVVSQGFYQDSVILDNFMNGPYRVVFTHGTKIFYGITIFKDNTLNIEEINNNILVRIYPNPTRDKLKVMHGFHEDKNTTLSIFNMSGQIFYLAKEISENEEIDLTFLSRGVYFLKIQNSSNHRVLKFVKE